MPNYKRFDAIFIFYSYLFIFYISGQITDFIQPKNIQIKKDHRNTVCIQVFLCMNCIFNLDLNKLIYPNKQNECHVTDPCGLYKLRGSPQSFLFTLL